MMLAAFFYILMVSETTSKTYWFETMEACQQDQALEAGQTTSGCAESAGPPSKEATWSRTSCNR